MPVLAGLLLCGSLVGGVAAGSNTDRAFSLQLEGGRISLQAKDAALLEIVSAIAEMADLRLVQHASLDRSVSVDIDRQPLPDALDALLESESYQLYQQDATQADAIPGTLWIFSEGSSLAPAATLFFEAVLYRGTRQEKREAIRELRRLGTPPAVQALSLALSDDDAAIRSSGFAALEAIGSDDALAAIASAGLQSDPWIRDQAASALASGDADTAARYLTLALQDPDPRVRMTVVESLADLPFGAVPGEQAIDALSAALKDENLDVRMAAIDALEEIGGEVALRTLSRAAADQDPEVQESLQESLKWLGAAP